MQNEPQLRTVLKGKETGRINRAEARAAIIRVRAAKEAASIAEGKSKRRDARSVSNVKAHSGSRRDTGS